MGHARGLASFGSLFVAALISVQPAAAQESFKIGAPVSLSGRYAAYGIQGKAGIETAIEVWKKVKGDKVGGRPIETIFRDTQSSNQITVSLMNEYIQSDKVHIIIGPDGSNIAAAAVPPWKKLGARPIWMMPGGSSDVIEKEVGDDPYFFHTFAWSYYYHETNVKALKAYVGDKKKVAILYSDGAYGRSHIEDTRLYLKEGGFDIVADELIREGAADFGPTLAKIRARRPDILYTLVQTNDAIQLAKQIQSSRLNVPYLVGTAQTQLREWQDALGDIQTCWTGVTTWVSGLSYPADKREPQLFPSAADFEKMWMAKYNAAPDFLEVGYYITGILALLAGDETKSTDRERLKDWFEKQQYQTPLGDSRFIKSRVALHQAFGTMVVFQRDKKANGTIDSMIVYPEMAATGKLKTCTY